MIVTAAEVGIGLGIVVYLYRSHVSIENQEFNVMKG
jgi:NADH:ubiquinone oxidoreductase subunit K